MRSDRSMDHFTTLLTHRGYRVTVVGSVLLLKTAVSLLPYVFNGSMLWSKSDSCSAMPLAILLYVVSASRGNILPVYLHENSSCV